MENTYYFPAILLVVFISAFSYSQSKLSEGDHFADINNITLHYYVSGKGPVCLMPTPGWGPDITIYKNSLMPLEKYFTIVYYDTRISGQSTGPEDPTKYTVPDFVSDMEALRVYLEQEKIWIMGHSDSGPQLMYYGINNGDKLNGIIALQIRVIRDSVYRTEFRKMIKTREGKPYYERAADIYFEKDTTKYTISEFLDITMPFFFHDVNKIEDFKKLGDPHLSNKASENVGKSKYGRINLYPELNKITVPTLIVVSDDDFICDKISQGDRIHNSIPGSDEILIKDAGHFSWVEQPEQFFNNVTKWLEKQGLQPHY